MEAEGPAFIRVAGQGTDWKTKEGITVGSILADVVKVNGKDIIFWGFGWDYGGTVTNWNGGNLEGLLMTLETSAEDTDTKFLGETEVNSGDPGLSNLGIRVAEISVRF